MNTKKRAQIRQALRRIENPRPPAELLDRLKEQIPEHFTDAPEEAEENVPGGLMTGWRLAASIVVLVGLGWIALRTASAFRPLRSPLTAPSVAEKAVEPNPVPSDRQVADALAVDEDRSEEGPPRRQDARSAIRNEAKEEAPAMQDAPATERPQPQFAEPVEEIAGGMERETAQSSTVAGRVAAIAPPPPAAPQASAVAEMDAAAEGSRPALTKSRKSAMRSIDARTTSYVRAREYLSAGKLPPPDSVRIQDFINSFDYGDRPPRNREFAIYGEGAPSTLTAKSQTRILRLGIRAAVGVGQLRPRAFRTTAEVSFDPKLVSAWRLVGDETASSASSSALPEEGELGRGGRIVALYEIELKGSPKAEDHVATVSLRYWSSGWHDMKHEIHGSDLTPVQAPRSVQLAEAAAGFGKMLKAPAGGVDSGRLLTLAKNLASARPGDPQLDELAELIGTAADLLKTQ